MPDQTPSQTVGPFFGSALPYTGGPQLTSPHRPDAVVVHGRVTDGEGAPVPDALLEWWQAAPDGSIPRRDGSRARDLGHFTGFGRSAVDADGHYEFATLRPGAVPPATVPWALVAVFARGLTHHLFTRAYLVGAADPVPADPLLGRLPPQRAETLLARADGPASHRFDVRLQGERETVFLDYRPTR